ncbi:MAG: pyruvate dehydrogenase complex dihydrolipoyllysine-residue acetyltransferase, partial [Candidatus Marinimicrobia bacterium]|nr:pyruvate dehydrogenase complex dihydrolipoyllysine-residue acetyltransferase [Candidatus Neomarinimicrobiota bacterium]
MAQILLPELGEGIKSVEISDVSIKVGDNISIDDILIVVETDKASMEIPATEAGEVENVHVSAGDTLSPGEPIVTLTGDVASTKKNEEIIEEVPTEV